ncbi:MAG: hypothetical protein KDK23_15520 [Leptospiraceae bacterium]|nr:hypothetical protein [Leptospiraceae bacterium]
MKTNAPKSITWIIAVVLGGLGILASFVAIPTVSAYAGYLVMAGFVILAVATAVKGL